MNPLLLELIRQGLRLLSVAMMNVAWIPPSITALTGNEEVVTAIAGGITYLMTDTWWATSFIARWKAWRGRK